ncbi:MAG TPA: hypothetical protein VNL16_18000 [Chloroflexota bacterium]|nr:hypothetical protein [Chloroflexota bacterium]
MLPENVAEARDWLNKVEEDFAANFRYPDSPPIPSAAQAQQEFQLAREIHESVLDRLPPEVRI